MRQGTVLHLVQTSHFGSLFKIIERVLSFL